MSVNLEAQNSYSSNVKNYAFDVKILTIFCMFCSNDSSSHRRCSIEKGVLKNYAKFTGEHLYQSASFNKVAGQ